MSMGRQPYIDNNHKKLDLNLFLLYLKNISVKFSNLNLT